MNCQEFDQILNELARPKLMDAELREKALAHSSACQLCAVRLANARSLTEGLKTLAAITESKSAPSHIEETLLAAFRQQTMAAASPKPSNVIQFQSKPKRLPAWALAAAAALVIAFGVFAASQLRKSPIAPATKDYASVPSPSPTTEIKRENETRIELATNLPGRNYAQPTDFGKPIRFQVEAKHISDGSFVSSSLGEFTPLLDSPNQGQEIATDFMPLTYDDSSQPMESGQVIRVQVPRTALASFGLPINLERANETVKADLLLADDGSARAIRFIR